MIRLVFIEVIEVTIIVKCAICASYYILINYVSMNTVFDLLLGIER